MKYCHVITRLIFIVLAVQILGLSSHVNAQSKNEYARTIDDLEKRYAEEILAHRKYTEYSRRACAEGHPNIAHLFMALSASEGIHARNFRKLLSELGAKPDQSLITGKLKVESTSYNLKHAANVERDEIDRKYPEILARIRPENHKEAITSINYAWQAEKQHRDLIIKIQKAAVRWFGFLVRRIEGKDSHYHVCQVCGSTLMEKTGERCPICGNSLTHYRTIEPLSRSACPVPETEDEEF